MFYVIANDAYSETKNAAALLESAGYPVWRCDGTADNVEIQAAIDALPVIGGWQVGHIHVAAGTYDIQTKISSSADYASILITGDGKRNTRLVWNTGVSGDYIFDFFAPALAGQDGKRRITIQAIGLLGGSTGSRIGKALKLGRTYSTEDAWYVLDNVNIQYYSDPAIYMDKVQLVEFYSCEVLVGASGVYSIKTTAIPSYINIFGGLYDAIYNDASYLKMFGGTLNHLEIVRDVNFQTLLLGVGLGDALPAGFDTVVKIGTTSAANHILIEGCQWNGPPATVGDYFLDIHAGSNIILRNNKWYNTAASGAPTVYYNIQSGVTDVTIDEPADFPFSRIADAGTRTKIGKDVIIEHNTAGDTLTVYESGSTHTNLGAGGAVTLNLPQTVHAGCWFAFVVMAAQELRIDPGAAGAIYINGAKQTDDAYITANDEAESVILTADGNGDWIASSVVGTWTVV